MKADIILKKKEDAVSPVIGVMLMLVVTIVIAAVVAAFAGGLGGDTEMAPTVILSADVDKSDAKVYLKSLSGDTLQTSKLSVKVLRADGTQIATGTFAEETPDTITPGTTVTVNLNNANGLEVGKYVTVNIISNGKHVILNKEVLVKN